MNRSTIRQNVLEHLREDPSNPVRWSVGEVNRYIDDGYQEVVERTGAVVDTTVLTAAGNNPYVTLPENTLYPIALKDVTTDMPIDPVHWKVIDNEDSQWVGRVTPTRPDLFAPWGLFEIILFPAYANESTVSLIHAIDPGPLASDSAEPDIPTQFHYSLVEYAIWRCMIKDADQERLQRAQMHFQHFEEKMGGVTRWTKDRNRGIFSAIYGERLRGVDRNVAGVGRNRSQGGAHTRG